MTQKSLDGIEWDEVQPENDDEEVEFISLQENETFTGLLMDKYPSTKYKGKQIYKLQIPHDPIIKIMIGKTMLDLKMKPVEIGTPVQITRLKDKPMDGPNDLQMYLVKKPKEGK